MKIFLSYGHDKFTPEVERIKADLEARGHKVWFDADRLKPGVAYDNYIEDGLVDCDKVVLVMTPHSVRRRRPGDPDSEDGFCLNEIAKARELKKSIVPVLLARLDSVNGPPVTVNRIQNIDMRNCQPFYDHPERYTRKFDQLLYALEHGCLDTEGGQARLRHFLRPMQFFEEYRRHAPN